MSEPKQLPIFGPSLNPASRIKCAMREAIKKSGKSRDEICDRLNAIAASEGLRLGRSDKVTLSLLDAWVAESKSHIIPVTILPAFCKATRCDLPIRILASSLGLDLVDEREAKILTLAKLDLELKKISRRKRHLQQEIEEDLP